MFKNIKCRDNFTLNGIEAPYLPMIINLQLSLEERTLYDVNQYIRSFVVDEKGVGRAKRVATSLCSFLNWFYYKRIRDSSRSVSYTMVNEATLIEYQKWLESNTDINEPSSRNGELKTIYKFYWFLEKRLGVISGIIGFTDGERGLRYELPVRKPSGSRMRNEFLIPILEKTTSKGAKPKSSYDDWLNAYKIASKDSSPLKQRDAIMIKVILDTALRREELHTLTVDLFDSLPNQDDANVFITLNKSKFESFKGKRVAPFPSALYRKIKTYIKAHRKKLKKTCSKGEKALFLSGRGRALGLSSINYILAGYGLRPHDGRKISLTDLFMERIKLGLTKEEAIMEVSEIAGHSFKSKGETLERCYLDAKAILNKQKTGTQESELQQRIHELELENKQLKQEIEESRE
ncbi:MAG: tyrosine-type recombinase/integrase [Pseudomonadota bacterium]|nr:hypothetical protein [Alteromonadaceae bacterium]MEA3381411.1 hypothetical protein [Pseudomonadota bacterium]|tara:strand:+ start:925 stop:2139 length:1215 start_codon:yes stop_codon:yes gene_type:complete